MTAGRLQTRRGPREGSLFVVGLPIGNPEDLSDRARRILGSVDLIAAEDTRVARTLLRRLSLRKPLLSYHEHNEESRSRSLLEKLREGLDVALVSDAGSPLVSDPGFRLVQLAAQEGIQVVPVPGPCAAIAALSVSGLPPDRFLVLGFLPRRNPKRRAAITELASYTATLVIFEAPHRILATLEDLQEVLGDREAALARSLTKRDEAIWRGSLSDLQRRLSGEQAETEKIRGEMTLVVHGADGSRGADGPQAETHSVADRAIRRLLEEGLSPRQVRDVVSDILDIGRRETYRRVHDILEPPSKPQP